MIDLHSHVLPGLDDGAQTMDDSLQLVRSSEADGVRTIAATPHVRSDYPTTPEAMEEALADVRAAVAEHGIPVTLVAGGEIALDFVPALSREDLARFTLGGSGRYVLVEFPYGGWPLDLEQRVFELLASGLTPILAHPERNRDVQNDPRRLSRTISTGALVQVTAAALDGRLGRSTRSAAKRLLELGLVHLLASDAHTPDVREAGLSAARDSVGDEALADWLTYETPEAILAGADLPPRPSSRKKRFGLF